MSGRHATSCHMCASSRLYPVLDLGYHPPSDAFLTSAHLQEPETRYPLRLVSCIDCGLLQIDYLVNPRILYQEDYPYESTMTETGFMHYQKMAEDVSGELGAPSGSLVVDIGSNDGLLLSGFKRVGMRVLGVDPAEPVAKKAIARGIETIIDFFDDRVAKKILHSHGQAEVITGTNVFAHLHDLASAVSGMKSMLSATGAIIIEAPYAVDLLENLEYDTIYHEHIGYLSVRPMQSYFSRFGLELFDVKKQSIHGGSLRYYVGHSGARQVSTRVRDTLLAEERSGLYSQKRLQDFARDVHGHKQELLNILLGLKRQEKKIAGISAPAKGNTLLNFCSIDYTFLDFITEKSSLKIGRFTPGTHIPIHPDQALMSEGVQYGLILAWNFADEIMRNLYKFKDSGGKFIIPIPHPRIV